METMNTFELYSALESYIRGTWDSVTSLHYSDLAQDFYRFGKLDDNNRGLYWLCYPCGTVCANSVKNIIQLSDHYRALYGEDSISIFIVRRVADDKFAIESTML